MMKAPSPRLGALRLVIATPAQDEQRPTERPDGSPLDFQTHNKKRYQDGTKARSQSLRRCTPYAAAAGINCHEISTIYLNMRIYPHISQPKFSKPLLLCAKFAYSGILDFHYPDHANRDILQAPKPPPSAFEWMCDAKVKTTFHRLSGLDCRPRKP